MLAKTALDKKEVTKIKSDLLFLNKLLAFSKKHDLRLIVSGGYGLDGILNTITRPHNDLDIILYGQLSRKKAIKEIKKFTLKHHPPAKITAQPNQFSISMDINAKGFGCNIYFVETVNNPSSDIKTIKLANGKIQVNAETRFPPPIKARLNNVEFEAQNPNLHLADILFKRKKDKQVKHAQDIQNLKTITNPQIVKSILAQY